MQNTELKSKMMQQCNNPITLLKGEECRIHSNLLIKHNQILQIPIFYKTEVGDTTPA